MPKFKIVLSPSQRRKLAGVGLVLLVALAWTGISVLQDTAVREADARKDVTALAFEKKPDAWLNNPTEASAFEKAVSSGQVTSVATSGSLVLYTDKAGKHHSTRLVDCGPGCSTNLLGRLGELSLQKGFVLTRTDIDPRTPSQKFNETLEGLGRLCLALLPVFLIAGLMFYQMRGGALPFGGTKLAERPDTEFKDVIGADEAKKALRRVVAFMTDPAEYVRVGAHAPRGVLIDGPPGTGKTLLARALAKECGANFISVDGSHFSAMFYGAGIGKVKELFERARKNAPCIIFIDELDGVGKRSRGGDGGAGDQEQNRIINRILVELDGFSPLENVVVVGATNHVDNIDKAMRRPGRFDMIVRTELPTTTEREALFALYLDKVKAAEKIDLTSLARTATGMSPADIANCVNRAASYAAEGGAPEVTAELLYRSIETFQLGGEVSSAKGTLCAETLRRLAVHEGGHGLVAHVLDAGSVERVSIEPRGGALGVTYVARHTEEPLYGERELKSRLAMLLAGREAEMMMFGNTSSGAADDLKRASELATSMIGSFGFGKTFGLLSMAGVPKELIGPDIQKNLLDEARLLLEQAQAECQTVLTTHRARLEALTALLLDQETVSGQPLQAVLNA
ncbi:MAG: AAA family ATPase [Aquabacterium sp.]|uniref:AAA family ATPase n=1 Tax=Aquabacterium sp. TaxID=1872578 RepID=UPI0027228D7B|nr:AAA family ATPase [Aquabacterium sp.]MDO9005575.1 AAA family ATPase [Aquabacterium sp.]